MPWLAIDLDGTLITCEPRQSAALRAAAKEGAVDVDPAMVWRLKREGASTRMALLELGWEPQAAGQVAGIWSRIIELPGWLSLDRPFAETYSTLMVVRRSGWSLALVTARSRPEWLRWQLQRLGLTEFFDEVTVVPTGSEATQGKSRALARIAPAGFWGDTESDAEAARRAQVPFFPLSTGQRSAAFLTNCCSSPTYASLKEAWAAMPSIPLVS